MTFPCPACEPRGAFGKRMHRIGMALFGPAEMGPYGPAAGPPPPRPRDHKGRLIKEPKVRNQSRWSRQGMPRLGGT